MRDEQTGTWWQQVSGKAILGPLKSAQLKLVAYDEVSFGLWKKEAPESRVLRPKQGIEYGPPNWEEEINKLPVVLHTTDWPPRTLVVGIDLGGVSKAYPFLTLQKHSLLIDQTGSVPILILLADDRKSVHVFDRRVDHRTLEFFASSSSSKLLDSETGSEWNFEGIAVSGPLQGHELQKIHYLKDFWFDWKNYHPQTLKYKLEDGSRNKEWKK